MRPDYFGIRADESAEMTRPRIRDQKSFNIIFATLFASIVLAIGLLIDLAWAWQQMQGKTWVGTVVLVGGAATVAGAAYWIREVKKLWLYPVFEIAAGVAISSQVAAYTTNWTIALIGFVGAVRIMIDGLKRLEEFTGIV